MKHFMQFSVPVLEGFMSTQLADGTQLLTISEDMLNEMWRDYTNDKASTEADLYQAHDAMIRAQMEEERGKAIEPAEWLAPHIAPKTTFGEISQAYRQGDDLLPPTPISGHGVNPTIEAAPTVRHYGEEHGDAPEWTLPADPGAERVIVVRNDIQHNEVDDGHSHVFVNGRCVHCGVSVVVLRNNSLNGPVSVDPGEATPIADMFRDEPV